MEINQLNHQPNYFSSVEELNNAKNSRIQTNPKYKFFTQTHFTAGDKQQFNQYRDKSILVKKVSDFNLSMNIFNKDTYCFNFCKYQNSNKESVNNTFNYLFYKFKKGIYVKIQNNTLITFLPFSNTFFENEWSQYIKIDPQYETMHNFILHINTMLNKQYKIKINSFIKKWYANNAIIRYDFPITEGDTNVSNMHDMLLTLCKERKIPNIEVFINRRDFPQLTTTSIEAYDNLFGENVPLVSHNYNTYCPLLSMVSCENYADISIPTGEDWARISSIEQKYFRDYHSYPSINDFTIEWKNKKETAVFRGSTTGSGVTIDTNMRLKLAYLSVITKSNIPLLDAGITKWQLRPRKIKTNPYLQTIDITELNKLGIQLSSFLTPIEQSSYKYIINVEGHVASFRLSLEMAMGSCILLVDSKYKLWFQYKLQPMVHYIPIKNDLSNLIETIYWCRQNDDMCKKIALNSQLFYRQYLSKDGILDYLQNLLCNLNNYIM